MNDISALCIKICNESSIELDQLEGIGVGMPGTVDPNSQEMLNGNSKIFINRPFRKDLSKLLKCTLQIFLENDASCFAFSEIICGVGQKYAEEFNIPVDQQIGIGVILGTGVGGGIVIKGNILTGKSGGGGEIGHGQLIINGKKCYCGQTGCAEQYLSGSSIEQEYLLSTKTEKSAKQIFADYQTNPNAKKILNNYLQILNIFLTNITNIFDPHYFVFGGGVSSQNLLYNQSQQLLKKSIFLPMACPEIYKNILGDSAGVIGAALLPLLRGK